MPIDGPIRMTSRQLSGPAAKVKALVMCPAVSHACIDTSTRPGLTAALKYARILSQARVSRAAPKLKTRHPMLTRPIPSNDARNRPKKFQSVIYAATAHETRISARSWPSYHVPANERVE